MKTFTEFLELSEAGNKEHIYYVGKELWLAYAQGSGTTVQVPNLKTFLTDKKDDSHYDSSVTKIVKFAHSNKPLKQNGDKRLFEFPEYPTKGNYDIWGGDVKPTKMRYLTVVEDKNAYVAFFDSKAEALSWIK